MLRAHLFVDLHTVVRQSIRASVERYSIKDLEPFFGYERYIDLRQANSNRHRLELFLETGRIDEVSDEMRRVVELYNRDDCASLIRLRNWLEEHRADLISRGRTIERPTVSMVDAVDEEQDDTAALKDALLADVTVDRNERTAEQHARWLMAHMLRWHKREANTQWWEKFRLADLDAKDLFDERAGISGLRFLERVVVMVFHRYIGTVMGTKRLAPNRETVYGKSAATTSAKSWTSITVREPLTLIKHQRSRNFIPEPPSFSTTRIGHQLNRVRFSR